jgi:hypothetical protein
MPRKIAAKQARRCGETWNLQSYWRLKSQYFQILASIVHFTSAPHIPIFFLGMERNLGETGILEVRKDARAYVDVQAPVVLKMQHILCRRRRPISLHGLAETRHFRFMYVGIRKMRPNQLQHRPMILSVAEDRVDVGVEFSDGKVLEKPLLETFERGLQQFRPSCGYKTDVNASFWHFLSHFSHLKPPYLAAAIPYPYQKHQCGSMSSRFRQLRDILHDHSNNKENCDVCSCILLAHRPKGLAGNSARPIRADAAARCAKTYGGMRRCVYLLHHP